MGRKFLGHAALLDSSGGLHQFVPGDPVPDWADSIVGYLLAPSGESAEVEAEGEPEGEAPAVDAVQEPAIPEDPADESAPDFTKPAPAKRGRPRKAE